MMKSPVFAALVVGFASLSLYAQVPLGSVRVGASTAYPVTVTITNPGTISSISVVTQGAQKLDFAKNNGGTCREGKTYQADDTCTVRVVFTPTLAGTRMGGVSLADANGNPLGAEFIRGTGLGPQAAFQPATQVGIFSNLNNVEGLSVDASGNVYAAESETSFGFNPGSPDIPGGLFKATNDGNDKYTLTNIASSLADPVGVAVDGDGNVLEADAITGPWLSPEQGTATSMPGSFHQEQSLAVDAEGNIYSAGYGAVYKSSPAFAPTQAYSTVVAGLGSVRSIAVDGLGNIYVPDSGAEPAVYKETPTASGKYVQTKIGSGWVQPTGVAVDASGTVYINDSGTLYSETPQTNGSYHQATVLAGQNNGASPAGLAVDGNGSLYVPVYAGAGPFGSIYNVDKFDRSAPPTLSFATTSAGSTSTDSPRTVTISNQGTEPLQFFSIHYPDAFPESKQWSEGRCSASTTLASGATCTVVVDFSPQHDPGGDQSSKTLNDKIEVLTNSLNGQATKQIIPVTGTKTKEPVAMLPLISQPSGTYSSGQTITLSDSTPGAVLYYTLDGKTPSATTGLRYTGPGTLENSATLKVIAIAPGHAPSNVASATYHFVASKPVISPVTGFYKGTVTVTMTGATPGAKIYYTTGGEMPSASSKVYTGPFTISADQQILAVAAKTGFDSSAPAAQIYKLTSKDN